MTTYKKINIAVIFSAGLATLLVYWYWQSVCVGGGCSYELRNGLLRPLLWSSISFLIITTPFLFLPSSYFKHWLYKIFSWGFLVSLILVANIETYSSGILSVNRGQMAQLLGVFLGVLSVLFIIFRYIKLKRSEAQIEISK